MIARSFARIHEANLEKQGVLALTFSEPSGYDAVREGDTISVLGLRELQPERGVRVRLEHADGSREELDRTHSLTEGELEWFRAGSLINWIRDNGEC